MLMIVSSSSSSTKSSGLTDFYNKVNSFHFNSLQANRAMGRAWFPRIDLYFPTGHSGTSNTEVFMSCGPALFVFDSFFISERTPISISL